MVLAAADTGNPSASERHGRIVANSDRIKFIYGGTSEIMKTIIARDLTGLRA